MAPDSWEEWQHFVLEELKRIANEQTRMNDGLVELRTETALHKQAIGWFTAGVAFAVSAITTATISIAAAVFKG